MKKFHFLFAYFVITIHGYCQSLDSSTKLYYELLRTKDIGALEKKIENADSTKLAYKCIKWELEYLKNGVNNLTLHKRISSYSRLKVLDRAIVELHHGNYNILNNDQDLAFSNYKSVLGHAKEIGDSLLICTSLYNILQLKTKNPKLVSDYKFYIEDYTKYAYNNLEKAYANYYRRYFKVRESRTFTEESVQKDIHVAMNSGNKFCLLEYYQRIGVGYDIYLKQYEKALKFYSKSLDLINEFKDYHFIRQREKGILNNIGCIYFEKRNYESAVKNFNKAFKIKSTKKRLINDSIISDWLVKGYKKLNKIDSAMYFLERKEIISQELNQLRYVAKVEEANKRYNVNIEKNKKRTIVLILTKVIITLIMVGYLIYRSLSRKKRLLEQEKELILKDQELQSIDAMVEGQEKERQRIANELHDDLGGLLATLKLYVQNLKVKKAKLSEEHDLIVSKTDSILEEAYQKVRSIAQTRNSGVLTSEGLLPTIRNYASKVSASNNLIVEIEDYGMVQRLGNSTEITVFRIVQELITNVIKHAKAEKISIDVTNHENSINIIVEDNGIGFDKTKVNFKKGMGLSSIMTRIKNLGGTIDIDSKLNFGTTIILNIPL